MEVNGQLHASAALSPSKNPRYPLDKRLCGLSAVLDVTAKRKNTSPAGNWTPVFQVVALSLVFLNMFIFSIKLTSLCGAELQLKRLIITKPNVLHEGECRRLSNVAIFQEAGVCNVVPPYNRPQQFRVRFSNHATDHIIEQSEKDTGGGSSSAQHIYSVPERKW